MKITAVGRWEIRGSWAERRYEVYRRVKRGWILIEKGWLRKGSLPTQRFRWVYDPWFQGNGYEIENGFCFVYNNIEEFFDVTLLDPEDLLPEWAEAYVIF